MSKTDLTGLPRVPEKGSRWRHFKGGVYTVVCVAREEATLEPVVVYRSPSAIYWTRPHAEFMDGRFSREPEIVDLLAEGGEL